MYLSWDSKFQSKGHDWFNLCDPEHKFCIVCIGTEIIFCFSDMKNLIGEALCGICQESFSTTITGTYTIILGFGELAIEVFRLFKKKSYWSLPKQGLCVCMHDFYGFQEFLCVDYQNGSWFPWIVCWIQLNLWPVYIYFLGIGLFLIWFDFHLLSSVILLTNNISGELIFRLSCFCSFNRSHRYVSWKFYMNCIQN